MNCRVRACRHLPRFVCYAATVCCGLLIGCGTASTTTATPPPSSGNSTSASAVQEGAQLGLTWSPGDATLRPIVGVPGSARFGSSIVAAGSYSNAAYSAQGQLALVVDKSNNLYLLTLPGSQPALLTQGIPASATIRFSPLGGYAIVYAPGAASAILISGLPKQPLAAQIQAGAAIQAAAVSDAGTSDRKSVV